MGVEAPKDCGAVPFLKVLDAAKSVMDGGKVEKALIYAPDAIGEGLYRDFYPLFSDVRKMAPVDIETRSVVPTWTPVCFASMFSGASPEVHGITRYEKPVLRIDTIFDALPRAGKRVAIVAVKGCSIDLIFRGRSVDYYTEEYDPQVAARALELIDDGRHDFIVAYNQEYDDLMHGSTPRDPKALEAFKRHLATFIKLASTFDERQRKSNRIVAFTPDHGTHIDPQTGKGTHGTDSPEDIEVHHFWGVRGRG